MVKCPICSKELDERKGEAKHLPFCSERCRAADLARWFGEKYAAPVETERVLNEVLPDPLDGE